MTKFLASGIVVASFLLISCADRTEQRAERTEQRAIANTPQALAFREDSLIATVTKTAIARDIATACPEFFLDRSLARTIEDVQIEASFAKTNTGEDSDAQPIYDAYERKYGASFKAKTGLCEAGNAIIDQGDPMSLILKRQA